MLKKMVRKRAPAQKGLSPEKSVSRKRKVDETEPIGAIFDEKTPKLDANDENEEIDGQDETNELHEEGVSYDDLPDFNTFSKELTEKTKTFWGTVISDYSDFTNWTCLLQTVTETEENIEAGRAVYNCFLRYYPYCYGYWKKFADMEKKNGNYEEADVVFQRGVKAIPVSIDLWVHYLNFTIQQHKGKENSHNVIRSLFDQAIEAAGMEFKSNKLWDAYIEWEKSLGNLKHVTEIYDKLIATPTQQYMRNWQRFKEHLEKYTLAEILPTEEYSKVMQQVDAIPPGMTSEDDTTIITTEPPGEGSMTSIVHGDEHTAAEEDNDKTDKAGTEMLKKKVIAERESVFVETAGEIKKRWKYEDAIKRPYFHVKSLEKAQLKNWKEYLDYEIREGSHKRICFLFERCLVACALYEEFWQKYIDYVESCDVDKTHDVYYRACNVHLRKNYKISIAWATFEEKQQNYKLAAKVLQKIDINLPGMILITQRRVGLARRMGQIKDVHSIYEKAIEKSEKIEDKIFYCIKYAHSLAKFCNNKSKARDMLWKALHLGKKHKRLYLQLLDLEMHYGTIEHEHIDNLFSAVDNDMTLSDEFQDMFSLRKIEFYEEYCDDITTITELKESYETDCKKRESVKQMLSNSALENISLPVNEPITNQSSLVTSPSSSNPSLLSQENQWYGGGEPSKYWANYAAQYAANYQQQ